MIKVRALKSVPAFGLTAGQLYSMPPYDAATLRAAGFVEFVQEAPKRGRPRKEA